MKLPPVANPIGLRTAELRDPLCSRYIEKAYPRSFHPQLVVAIQFSPSNALFSTTSRHLTVSISASLPTQSICEASVAGSSCLPTEQIPRWAFSRTSLQVYRGVSGPRYLGKSRGRNTLCEVVISSQRAFWYKLGFWFRPSNNSLYGN